MRHFRDAARGAAAAAAQHIVARTNTLISFCESPLPPGVAWRLL